MHRNGLIQPKRDCMKWRCGITRGSALILRLIPLTLQSFREFEEPFTVSLSLPSCEDNTRSVKDVDAVIQLGLMGHVFGLPPRPRIYIII